MTDEAKKASECTMCDEKAAEEAAEKTAEISEQELDQASGGARSFQR